RLFHTVEDLILAPALISGKGLARVDFRFREHFNQAAASGALIGLQREHVEAAGGIALMQAHENLYIQTIVVTAVGAKRGAQFGIGNAAPDRFGDACRETAVSQRLLKIAGRELQLRQRREHGALSLPAPAFLED